MLGFVSKSDVFGAVFIGLKVEGIAAKLMVKFKTPIDEMNGQMVPNTQTKNQGRELGYPKIRRKFGQILWI